MDPEDFTVGEAEQLDYNYRLPLYSTMELFIETLTGTCFELRVSAYERVISVKAKIQQLEGIPITQQFLIWQNVELEDEYCLHDYNITDGCTLKLVLAMRGGPINTRRIAMEEPGLCEMADYCDSNQEEFLEKLSPPPSSGNGNKQVTLLVYRDGDQLNFFRVVDRGDGTLTPFSESLSGSACNVRDTDDEEVANSGGQVRRSPGQQPLSVAQMVENNITAAKMKQLRSQMNNLQLLTSTTNNKHKKQLPSAIPATPLIKPDEALSRPTKSGKVHNKAVLKEIADKVAEVALAAECASEKEKSDVYDEEKKIIETKAHTTKVMNLNFEKDAVPVKPTSAKPIPISKTDFRRAQLKRMKSVNDSEEVSDEIKKCSSSNKNESFNSDIPDKADTQKTLEISSDKTPQGKKTPAKPDLGAEGRFSPRTRRLLNALENSTAHKRPPATNTTAYKSPRSTMLQGMTFNRHDMYLRSYGLIASPDEATDGTAESSSEKPPSPIKSDQADVPAKVYETSQGVKYSALGGTRSHYHGAVGRYLKSPPVWATSKDTSARAGGSWHPTPKPPATRLHRDNLGGGERLLRPPSSNRNAASSALYQKSIHDNMMTRTSKNFNLNRDIAIDKVPAKQQWQKLDSISASQPSLANVNLPWQKQKLQQLNINKPSDVDSKGHLEGRAECRVNEDPLIIPRHPFRQSSSKSGLRMKEASHGKVESMSRQEAREVVDFINKAVDASILRTLVRSPVKDTGNSSTSHRYSGPNYRQGEFNKFLLQSSHSSIRGNNKQTNVSSPGYGGSGTSAARSSQLLPPVKPPTKKKRCFLCGKRTGLASSYICRCGNNFCATHRYAEAHNCTYDYKTTGRKIIEEANPLVSAPKLPKI